ncbi:MAG: DUF6261 family protein [Bacteroidales bacterium]|jgi:hypothetical protein|nr:DUF6261 family protein [Bacteroidales bacterium]
MKIKIERVHFSHLRNDEYALVVLYIINIGGKYDVKKLFLEKSYNELLSFRSPLESLKIYVRKNEKMVRLGDLDRERDILIVCINNVVKSFHNTELPEISAYYENLSNLLNTHQSKTIATDNRTSETERLQKLETDVNASAEIQKSFQVLGLEFVKDRLFAINKEYDALFQEYIAEKSTEERMDVLTLRKDCTKAVGQYYDAIQYCAFAHEENDYSPLIKELTQLSAYFNQQLKIRATRRKNGKNTSEDPSITLPEEELLY